MTQETCCELYSVTSSNTADWAGSWIDLQSHILHLPFKKILGMIIFKSSRNALASIYLFTLHVTLNLIKLKSAQFWNDGFLWVKTTECLRIVNTLRFCFFSQIKCFVLSKYFDISKTWKHTYRASYVGQTPCLLSAAHFSICFSSFRHWLKTFGIKLAPPVV